MRVFISGASGLVGSNCLNYFKEKDVEVVGTHLSYPTRQTFFFDTLAPENKLNFDVFKFCPHVIIHCGALTHVDYCETNEEESYQKTVQSTLNLIEVANKIKAKFVFLSTDYVFDGLEGPYTEEDATNPINIYGKHKLMSEKYIQAKCPNSLILRVTNVYGNEERNKNFVARIIHECEKGDILTLKLPFDQYASPVNAYDIARILYRLLKDDKTGIYHISGSDYMNRVELALRVLNYFPEAKYELEVATTKALKQIANRPLRGGFVKHKLASEYPEFLFNTIDDYLNNNVTDYQ